MSSHRHVERLAVGALAAFAFVNALAWAWVIPLGDAPDEPTHFVVVAFELIYREIPEVAVDDYGAIATTAIDGVRAPLYTYSAQPGLAYIFGAAAIELLANDSDEPARYARFPGALWSGLLVLVTFWGVSLILPSQPGGGLLAATIVAFWPQLTFVNAYINNDGLTVLVSAATIASWYSGVANSWRNRDVVVIGVMAGLILLNKPNGFPVAVAAAFVLLISLQGEWKTRARKMALAGVACLATSGWWYWIAFRRYGWDLLGTKRADAVRESLEVEWMSGRHFGKNLIETAFEDFPRFGETWIEGTLRTAVGAFGKLTIALPAWAYWTIAILTILALAGAVHGLIAARPRLGTNTFIHAITFGLIPLELVLALYRSWAFDFQAQGRYLFPVMLPFAAVLAFGLLRAFRSWSRALVGFVVTTCFCMIAGDAFLVTLLGAYRYAVGDLFSHHPLVASAWFATLLASLSLSVFTWLRVGKDGIAASRAQADGGSEG